MCRSIKLLNLPGQVPTDHEIANAALQFVRKISGFRKPSRANQAAFHQAISEIAQSSRHLIQATQRPPATAPLEVSNPQ
jgi:hypothetical protein